jgi:hypothetical protein
MPESSVRFKRIHVPLALILDKSQKARERWGADFAIFFCEWAYPPLGGGSSIGSKLLTELGEVGGGIVWAIIVLQTHEDPPATVRGVFCRRGSRIRAESI